MASINILLASIINTYIITHSWKNCIIHMTPEGDIMPIIPFTNTTSYITNTPEAIAILPEICECFILWTTTESTMEAIDRTLHDAPELLHRYNKRRIIAIDNYNRVKETKMKSLRFIADFLLISCSTEHDVLDDCLNFNLYTHKYIGKNNTEDLYLIDSYNVYTRHFSKNANLFQDKLTNQEGRLLRFGIHEYFPNVDLVHQTGSAFKTAIEYARKYNNRFLVNNCNDTNIKCIPSNIPSLQILNQLLNDEFDMMPGVAYLNILRLQTYNIASVTDQQEATMLVPKPKEINGWTIFTKEFTGSTWILFGSVLAAQTVLVLVIQRYRYHCINHDNEERLNFMSIWGINLQQGLPDSAMPTSTVLRTLIWLLFMQSVLYVTMWGSLLAVNLINPTYQDDIRLVKDFAESKFVWGSLGGQHYAGPLKFDPRPHFQKTYYKYAYNTTRERMQEMVNNGKLVTLQAKFKNFLSYDKLYSMETIVNYKPLVENLYVSYTVPFLRRSSILTDSYTRFQTLTRDTGLLDIWIRHATYRHMMTKIQLYLNYGVYEHNHVQPLTIVHFLSIFTLWGCGMIVAILLFLWEFLTCKQKL